MVRLPKSERDDVLAVGLRAGHGWVADTWLTAMSWGKDTPSAHERFLVYVGGAVAGRFPTKREAIQYLRCWRLMNGYNEDGTRP